MKKIVVVGAGASGLIAAIYAAKKGNEVIILEKNKTAGKKILVTGNGRCNYWNEDQDINHYHSNNKEFLNNIITEKNKQEILSFFDSIGIISKIKNGYYYPFSNQATSIQYALILQAKLNGVLIKTDFFVEEIIKEKKQFIINPKTDKIISDVVILAPGSKASLKDGKNGYNLVTSFGHTLTKILPALVQLKANNDYLKNWKGIRTEAEVSLYENNNFVKKEKGEIQLTDYGISGICILNLSRYVSIGLEENKKEQIRINFLPWLNSKNEVSNFLKNQNNLVKKRTISELLEGILNYKLVKVILKESCIKEDKKFEILTNDEKNQLVDNLYGFKLDITGTNSFENAQVCTGGVPLDEINNNMESIKVKNLYIVGEILDVDGDCGGYNLGFAWISGMLAGKNI